MKSSKFSDGQRAFILKQGDDGVPVAEICRKAGISHTTYFNWKRKYADLLPGEMRRLKALEDENSRLKKIVTDLTLDHEMLQDVGKRRSASTFRRIDGDVPLNFHPAAIRASSVSVTPLGGG